MKPGESSDPKISGRLIHITGRVQGVGMRPFIFRLANHYCLNGFVLNRPDGVIIHVEGADDDFRRFIDSLRKEAPPAANIKEIIVKEAEKRSYSRFTIENSSSSDYVITEICPDIAVCDDCLKELYSRNRRNNYPFINCTNCGPRFTLVNDFPYDRHNTTMIDFGMCNDCDSEYHDVMDRRFHAQPISCPDCGPVYMYHFRDQVDTDFDLIIPNLGNHINEGRVVALKGLGGYNLVCDATDPNPVNEIRKLKKREKKPFAVMFRSIEALNMYLDPDESEIQILLSWQRPIVIIDKVKPNNLVPEISTGLNSLGAFLPYMPLHYLLFDVVQTDTLVVTSGNESDIPILYQDEQALEVFKNISGGTLTNNRRIARRADDSVIKVIAGQPRLLRRARGYVPSPVDLHFSAENILATGAELSNSFCLGKENQAVLSQHIGDLKNTETYDFYVENIREFCQMYRFNPELIACDLHPDYLSTRYAEETGLPLKRVQHHHAHVAGVMAEYKLNKPVIGLCYDGTGYGSDGNIWGSELLIADYHSFERIGHFEYIALPGGDLAVKEPWRSTLAYLYHVFGNEWHNLPIPFLKKINIEKALLLIEAIDKKINTPLCCSAGRLFDAVAGLLSICIESNYHAQAPLLLENHIDPRYSASYKFSFGEMISFAPMIRSIVQDIIQNTEMTEIVTKFHNTVADATVQQILTAFHKHDIKDIVLSGGTFQNKYLTEKIISLLKQHDLNVYFPYEISCNDGSIAVGQLAVAAHK